MYEIWRADALGTAIVSGVLVIILVVIMELSKQIDRWQKKRKYKTVEFLPFGDDIECSVGRGDFVFLMKGIGGYSEFLRINRKSIVKADIIKSILHSEGKKLVKVRLEWKTKNGELERRDFDLMDDEHHSMTNKALETIRKYSA